MIIFDIEPLQNQGHARRGIERYVRNLIAAVGKAETVDFALAYNPALPLPSFDFIPTNSRVFPASRARMLEAPADWLVTCSAFEVSYGRTAAIFRECNPSGHVACIVYDLTPLVFEHIYLTESKARLVYQIGIHNVTNSDLLLTCSSNTADDVRRRIKSHPPLAIIGTGVADSYFEIGYSDDKMSWLRLITKLPSLQDGQYLFSIVSDKWERNLEGLLDAFATLSPDFRRKHNLVIGGGLFLSRRQHYVNMWHERINMFGGRKDDVVFLPYMSDEEIYTLYKHCRLFVYASRYDGFGLPLAEAVVCGAVCAASNASSLTEIVPVERFGFDVENRTQIAERMVTGCEESGYRSAFKDWARTARDSFRWQKTATALVDALSTFRGRNRRASRKGASVAALVGPLPPADSGIANYNSNLFPLLQTHRALQWFIPDDVVPVVGFPGVRPVSQLRRHIHEYDRYIYVIGNSYHHRSTIDLLRQRAGIVWLHDIFLGDLIYTIAQSDNENDKWAILNNITRTYYNNNGPYISSKNQIIDSSYCFARPLLNNATGFIVNSEYAKNMLASDLDDIDNKRVIHVIPHAIPNYMGLYNAKKLEKKQVLAIGLLGFVGPIKTPEIVIDAAGLLVGRGRDVVVRIIGYCDDKYFSVLGKRAELGKVAIERTGFLPDHEFLESVARVDVVIQLRRRAHGESSGTVAHSIGLGVPVISNIPTVRETWSDMVLCDDGLPSPTKVAELVEHSLDPIYLEEMRHVRAMRMPHFSFARVAGKLREIMKLEEGVN